MRVEFISASYPCDEHVRVPATALDFRTLWGEALPWDAFVSGARSNQALWQGLYRTAQLPSWAVERAHAAGPRQLLVLAEDWCGDASSTVPVLARLAAAVPTLTLRILQRDRYPDVMNRYLTEGARAIPVVIVLDAQFEERGWWGPRPAELQAWVRRNRDSLPSVERNRRSRAWYARDRGETTLREVLALL